MIVFVNFTNFRLTEQLSRFIIQTKTIKTHQGIFMHTWNRVVILYINNFSGIFLNTQLLILSLLSNSLVHAISFTVTFIVWNWSSDIPYLRALNLIGDIEFSWLMLNAATPYIWLIIIIQGWDYRSEKNSSFLVGRRKKASSFKLSQFSLN